MAQYTFEYIMCYKEAFALGMATGLLVAVLYSKRAAKGATR